MLIQLSITNANTPPIDIEAAARLTLSAPAEVSGLETHGTELHVSTTATHGVHTVSAELGHGRGAAHLVHSLLLEVSLSTTGRSALVSTITRDSCTSKLINKYKSQNSFRGLYFKRQAAW